MAQTIEIVRGTTNTFQISVLDASGAPYNLGSAEKIVFGLKKEVKDEALLVVKVAEILAEGLFQVTLCPEDTCELDYGHYHYDVGLDDGVNFFNIIQDSPFIIVTNVTFRGCDVC